MDVGIIGAGVAGAAAGRRLLASGRSVVLFDKARGPGGRMSTKRAPTPLGERSFDHGCQFVTARTADFRDAVGSWRSAGAAAPWISRFMELGEKGLKPAPAEPRWVGKPGMNGLIRAQLGPLDTAFGAEVVKITGEPRAWRIGFADGAEAGPFPMLVVAVPAEQAAPLLESVAPGLAAEAAKAVTAPCWAVMAAYQHPFRCEFEAVRIPDGPLAWAAEDSSKPNRTADATWVLHGSSAFSRDQIDAAPEEAVAALVDAFRRLTNAPEPAFALGHLWRYAQVETPAETPFGFDKALGIGTCGDWRIGPRVELAWSSGDQLAAAICLAGDR